jgi:hypothetical protein
MVAISAAASGWARAHKPCQRQRKEASDVTKWRRAARAQGIGDVLHSTGSRHVATAWRPLRGLRRVRWLPNPRAYARGYDVAPRCAGWAWIRTESVPGATARLAGLGFPLPRADMFEPLRGERVKPLRGMDRWSDAIPACAARRRALEFNRDAVTDDTLAANDETRGGGKRKSVTKAKPGKSRPRGIGGGVLASGFVSPRCAGSDAYIGSQIHGLTPVTTRCRHAARAGGD